jgi:hypothetical protein
MCLGVGVCGGGWICGTSGGFLLVRGGGGGEVCGGCGGVCMDDGARVPGFDVFRFVLRLFLLGVDAAKGEGGVGSVGCLFCLFCVFRLFGV